MSTLERAFSVRGTDPVGASELFAGAGPGSILEHARLDAWFGALERAGADSTRWREFLAAGPTAKLAARATLELAAALTAEGNHPEATSVLIDAPAPVRHEADLALLEIGDAGVVSRAAHRLAREAPNRLRARSRSIERSSLAAFDHEDWMARAAAWRAVGLGSRGAAELRGLRRRGDEERQRRLELARCELDAGSTSRALNALPPRGRSGPEELTLRAEVHRRRAWGRVPDRSSTGFFATCLEDAERASGEARGEVRERALVLVVECGTEAGELAAALEAWRQLEAGGWSDGRRTWLGRRLGVALARSGYHPREVDRIASALPNHKRCLRYWRSRSEPGNETLAGLADDAVADLYGHWARRRTGREPTHGRSIGSDPVAGNRPPSSVAWLLANANPSEASAEWQRLLRQRRARRSEAVAAAELAVRAGRSNTAIRTLRSAFPGIGTVAIAEVPEDAAAAYLPLRFHEHLIEAARETGLDPWLIAAVARQESTFNAGARSPAGAVGVLQLLPATARLHSRNLGLGSRPDLRDPALNIRLGAHELAWLIRRFGAIEPALAAYNAGERRVRRWWRQWPEADVFAESIPIPETYNYVRRVVFLSDAYRQIHADAWSPP